jgi:hypothetical protein
MLLVAVRLAVAHVVPIPPSTCAFDPIDLEWPERHLRATVASPGADDVARITYDVTQQTAQVTTDGAARGFVAGDLAGSVRVPSFVTALVGDLDSSMAPTVVRSGDLVAPSASLELTVGGATATIPMALTTGLAAAAGRVAEGAAIDGVGLFVLAGVAHASGLPTPFGDGTVVVRLSCRAGPRPDIDQFRGGLQSRLLHATLTANGLSLRALVAADASIPLDFPGTAAVRASVGDLTLVDATLPAGLRRRGRRRLFVGASRGGRTRMGVQFLYNTAGLDTWELALKSRAPLLPAADGSDVRLQVTTELGGLLSRMSAPFTVHASGRRLTFP